MERKYVRWLLLFILGLFIILADSTYSAEEVILVRNFSREIAFTEPPNRIISLSPCFTEILFSMGLGDSVVGVSVYCNFPLEVWGKPRFDPCSLYIKGEERVIKEILSLKPDIVLMWVFRDSEVLRQIIDHFEREDVKVLVFETSKDIENIFQKIRLIGKIFNQRESAEKLIQGMQSDIEKIRNKTKVLREEEKRRVYVEIQKDPIITVGRNVYLQQIIEFAGGKNIFADKEGWPMVTQEEVIRKDPEIIIIFKEETERDEIFKREGWQEIAALKNEKVYMFEGDLLKRTTPKLMKGLMELARLLHPELFAD